VQVDLSGLAPGSLVVLSVSPVDRHAAALQALEELDLAALEAIIAKLGRYRYSSVKHCNNDSVVLQKKQGGSNLIAHLVVSLSRSCFVISFKRPCLSLKFFYSSKYNMCL
jgi:hypothetical protein